MNLRSSIKVGPVPRPEHLALHWGVSRGHGRVQRIILESVNSTRYGCTVRQLAYQTYGIGRLDAPTESQLVAVRRAVRRLLAEERVVERTVFGTDRYIFPATPRERRPNRPRPSRGANLMQRQTLQCLGCNLRWVSEQGAPHRLCWQCGEPGQPISTHRRRKET
jgi:hypothetical protein